MALYAQASQGLAGAREDLPSGNPKVARADQRTFRSCPTARSDGLYRLPLSTEVPDTLHRWVLLSLFGEGPKVFPEHTPFGGGAGSRSQHVRSQLHSRIRRVRERPISRRLLAAPRPSLAPGLDPASGAMPGRRYSLLQSLSGPSDSANGLGPAGPHRRALTRIAPALVLALPGHCPAGTTLRSQEPGLPLPVRAPRNSARYAG